MGSSRKNLKFKKGDLVRCYYEFQMYFAGYGGGAPDFYEGFFMGIVVGTRPNEDDYSPNWYGPWYEVLCFDGNRRYFSEWEMQLLGRVE